MLKHILVDQHSKLKARFCQDDMRIGKQRRVKLIRSIVLQQ
jgi:hypothetical protein